MQKINFPSKLPALGTTIFSTMSVLAVQHNAINLGQGFPDFDCSPKLIDAVYDAMREGMNQYPPMPGLAVLRHAIAEKIATQYSHQYDPDTEITVTAGATQALLTVFLACVQSGDEVIVIEPCYDSYLPAIRLAGGIPVLVPMSFVDSAQSSDGTEGGYSIPWDQVAAAITPKTRAIVLNSPHNPTGSVLTKADIFALRKLVQDSQIVLISDEVYEHMVFDAMPHESLSRYPDLAERSFIISSFGKTFHVTGWKVGYVAAPAHFMQEFRKVHQFNVFTVNSVMQAGIASYLQDPTPYLTLPDFYQEKRDFFREGLEQTRFKLLPCAGTYFQSVDYSAISDLPELEFAQWLTSEIKVAAIPLSAFYQQPNTVVPESSATPRIIRFCFAKKTETLIQALQRLQQI